MAVVKKQTDRVKELFQSSFLYKTIDSATIFQVYVLVVIAAKIVRWTVMYANQVAMSIGHTLLKELAAGNFSFYVGFVEDSGSGAAGGNSLYLYHLLDFFHLTTYEGWEIYISILSNIVVLLFLTQLKRTIKIYQWLVVTMTVAVLNIFSFCLAKDPIQMLYFVAIGLVLLTKWDYFKKCIAVYILLFWAIVTFRAYYVLVFMFVIASQVICKLILNRVRGCGKRIVLFTLCMGLFCFIFLSIAHEIMYDNYTMIYNARYLTRSIENANTGIKNWFDGENPLMFTVNWITVVFRLLLPFELVSMGPKYWIYVIYQLIITGLLYRAMRNLHRNKREVNLAFFVYLGFVLGSAMFEPDFGSWVRHESVCFAVIFAMSDIVGFPKSKLVKYTITVS